MEYCSYIWGGVPQSACLDLLDSVQRKLVNLIGPVLSSTLQSLSHRRVSACFTCITMEMFPETVISDSPWTIQCNINTIFWELAPICWFPSEYNLSLSLEWSGFLPRCIKTIFPCWLVTSAFHQKIWKNILVISPIVSPIFVTGMCTLYLKMIFIECSLKPITRFVTTTWFPMRN